MLLIGLLFVLFTVGFVVPCLLDVARTPHFAIRTLTKRTWILLIVSLSVVGGVAWLLAGRPARSWQAPTMPRHLAGLRGLRQQEAYRRHPAGRAGEPGLDALVAYAAQPGCRRPLGPDDDPEFLLELARRISGEREADNDA
jgi:hypothetical protein